MSIRKVKQTMSLFFVAFGIVLLAAMLSYAQESGLGYSEAPFALIENATAATGNTPLEAIRSASADEGEIVEDNLVEQGNYSFSTVTFNYIGISAVTQKVKNRWQFVCRAGGLMQPEELIERCGVPADTAQSLYANFLEALSKDATR